LVHPEHRSEIESYLRVHENPRLRFVWVSLPSLLDPWNPRTGEAGIHLHYMMWQHAALSAARRLQREVGFDVCQFVSWATVLSSPLLWKLPVPFFWGPIGGAQTAPLALRSYLGAAWRKEALRVIQLRLRRVAPSLRATVRHSTLILSSNSETTNFLASAGARKIELFPADSGVPTELIDEDGWPVERKNTEVRLHWSGRIEPRKGLALALEAFAQACLGQAVNLQLEISGDGSDRAACESLARKLGIDAKVRFLGQVPRSQVIWHLRQADAFLFTSLRDTVGSVCFESMAAGIPIIMLNHQGVHDFVPPAASWRVLPSTQPETVQGLAAAIRCMAANRQERLERGRAAREFAITQTWARRIEHMEHLYERYLTPSPSSGDN
jgi:glycosyltransferase involved in cell wall biosynthesis